MAWRVTLSQTAGVRIWKCSSGAPCVPWLTTPCSFSWRSCCFAGTILRQSKTLSATEAARYATEMLKLTAKARHVVRDIEPKNELEFFRLRGKEREILAAPGDNFMVVVIQRWKCAADAESK